MKTGIGLALALPALLRLDAYGAGRTPSSAVAAGGPTAYMRWVLDGQLARASRPGFTVEQEQVPRDAVDGWLSQARGLGIRSIICLLSDDELTLYQSLPTDLISYYRARGFAAAHIPVRDRQSPPLTDHQLGAVWRAYQQLPKPILVHCNAGIGRTGAAVEHIVGRLGGRANGQTLA